MSINIDLGNKNAIITGVSSGIGMGIAFSLAEAGCNVAGCGLDPEDSAGAKLFIAKVESLGRRAYYQTLDISDAKAARNFINWAATQLGGLDIVVSNAGRNIFYGVEKTTETDWEANIELNLAAHWRLVQAAKPYLENAKTPVIIIISSNHAYRTLRNCFPYNVAKAGLISMVQSIAIEWGPKIRAVGIAPGFIETPQGEKWFNDFPDPSAKRTEVAAIHPVGRMGMPADVGALCAFVASPLASFITGNTLLIDGGRSALMQDG